MSTTAVVQRLHDEYNTLVANQRAVFETAEAESRDLSAEEIAADDQRDARMQEISERITDLRKREARQKETESAFDDLKARAQQETSEERGAGGQGGEDVNEQLRKFLRGEAGKRLEIRASDTDRQLFRPEHRANDGLYKGALSAGGATVPKTFFGRLIEHMIEVSAVMQAGPTMLQTDSGEPIQIPRTTGFSNASIVPEKTPIPQSEPTFDQTELSAYKYGVLLQISTELLTDTGVDLESFMARQAGRALGNAFGQHLLTGTGSGQPSGLLPATTAGKTGANAVAGAFTADNLIDLFYSVIGPYRNSPGAGWILDDTAMAAARKLKDNAGQYIFSPALVAGEPNTMLGKPVYTDPFMTPVGVGAKSVVFGDISAYFVRLVRTLRFEMSEHYAFNTDVVTYRALMRGDGQLVDVTGAVKAFVGGAAS